MMSTPDSIFISIAAYREFDLEKTILDALARAHAPSRLRFVVCWQHGPEETVEALEPLPNVELIAVPHTQSQGVCWARAMIQSRYQGEAFFLQLDAHHRFVDDWDDKLISMLEGLEQSGVAKPILTTYLPGFDPNNDPEARAMDAWCLGFDYFDASGIALFRPYTLKASATSPVPTAFWSAHFSFSRGRLIEEVPVDPKGYFHGEEISMAVRAFTHGYDLFSPHELIAWHEYTRKGRICHWNDHDDWMARNEFSIQRFNALLGVDGRRSETEFGRYGLGQQRTLRDYEAFAGLDFATRSVAPTTLEHQFGQALGEPSSWGRSFSWHAEVKLAWLQEPEISFIGVFVNAADGQEIYRYDISRPEMDALLAEHERQESRGGSIAFPVRFLSPASPASVTVWPHDQDKGWLTPTRCPWPSVDLPKESP